jgi:outer membrane receptor for ferric coprogen and ferric-rhodotorulic acid
MPLSDVRDFDPRDYPNPRPAQPPVLGFDGGSTLDQYGAFTSLRVYFSDAWSVTGGARIGSDHIDTKLWLLIDGQRLGPLEASFGNRHVVTPYGGVMYTFNDHYSWYTSYADIYLAGGTPSRVDGTLLGAVRGATIETGIKGAWRDGTLNGALVLYRIHQSNLPLGVPTPPGNILPNCCFEPGTSKSRGVDLELSGELARGWLIGSGYTYNLNEAAGGGGLSTATPLHLLKVWSSTELPGAFDRWTLGGSLHAQSKTTTGVSRYCHPGPTDCIGFYVVQKPYAVLDLRAGFRVDPNWQLALSVKNVLDKRYYESLGLPELRTWYGEPRSVMLRIDGSF